MYGHRFVEAVPLSEVTTKRRAAKDLCVGSLPFQSLDLSASTSWGYTSSVCLTAAAGRVDRRRGGRGIVIGGLRGLGTVLTGSRGITVHDMEEDEDSIEREDMEDEDD
jgi:hypothetical protein